MSLIPPLAYDERPIGIFDSGVGGLTVLRAVARRLPGESFLYLGDTARVPYGAKSARTVARYTIQVADYLLTHGVKALVVACNTASALGLEALRGHTDLPVLGVIRPGCQAAVDSLRQRPGRVAVIGTRSTIQSGAYPAALAVLAPGLSVTSLACPMLVPLVEEGWLDRPSARLMVAESLQPLLAEPPATLILGCTHYPVLKPLVAAALGGATHLVDSAEALAGELHQRLGREILPAPPGAGQTLRYWVTDVAERFQEVAGRFLGDLPIAQVEMVDL